MAKLQQPEAVLAVIRFADGWRILPGGLKLAPYPSQEAALVVARHLVQLAELSGQAVRLLVHDTFGELREADCLRRSDLPSVQPDDTQGPGRPSTRPSRHLPSGALQGFGGALGAGFHLGLGGYPALAVLRSRSPRASRPEPHPGGEVAGNDR